jgi:hypothetical protein
MQALMVATFTEYVKIALTVSFPRRVRAIERAFTEALCG